MMASTAEQHQNISSSVAAATSYDYLKPSCACRYITDVNNPHVTSTRPCPCENRGYAQACIKNVLVRSHSNESIDKCVAKRQIKGLINFEIYTIN